jgi:hypothetical protein
MDDPVMVARTYSRPVPGGETGSPRGANSRAGWFAAARSPVERGAKLVPAMPREGLAYRQADEGVAEGIALGVFYQNTHLQCAVQGVEECRI